MTDVAQRDLSLRLKGKCIISTRPFGKSEELARLLKAYGAELLELPMIELTETKCDEICYDALTNLESYTHVVFTSAYGFEFFMGKLKQHDRLKELITKVKIVSIGYKTSELIKSYGLKIDFDAQAKTGEEFADKFVAYLKGKEARVIWSTGNLSPNNLAEKVSEVARMTRLNIYENSIPLSFDRALINKIKSNDYDLLVLASPSAFRNLYGLVNIQDLKVVCIGQTTAREVKKHGMVPLAIADEPSALGITNAILDYYKNH